MTVENIDLKTIGFFSLVGQAYVFKFLWSPLMDRYTPPIFWAGGRGWAARHANPVISRHCGDGFSRTRHPTPLDGGAGGGDRFLLASQDIVFDA
ncbi:AmpG muropeptide MFS transporter [Escherichia coli]|uniref:AmpG muropeptide MFS transporter n=1 Tax=Escherichia coli TaxID=562 RepID=A0A376RN49_ECOLX|nr:AmpG muropeptide MFS transporter [Escherichia coli]